MAQKRMFNNLVIGSDDFMEMPDSSQNLYFHLSMKADDDGFVDNWKSIMRMTRKTSDDLKILIEKMFIIPFDTGVIVIRHWRLNNYLRSDRYKETIYKKEKSTLEIDNNGVYRIGIPDGHQTDTIGIRSIDKNSIDKNSKKEKKKKNFEDVFKENNFSKELEDTLKDFIDMRKAVKKPMTTRALELLIKKLMNLTKVESEQILILNQSIMHGWQTVYPLKKEDVFGFNNESNKKAVDTSRLTQEEYSALMRKEISIEELIEKGRVDVL